MAEFEIIKENIERRTYLKGRFRGKLVGYLDSKQSDRIYENFYDLEVLSGEAFVKKSDFRTWKEGDEFDEFLPVEKFLTKLPSPLNCEVSYEDGNIKHFKIQLNEPKLQNYNLSHRLYEGNEVFATIEGEISGYLKHFDTIEREVEIISSPAPSPINKKLEILDKSTNKKLETSDKFTKDLSNSNFNKTNKIDGCFDLTAKGFAYAILSTILLIIVAGIVVFIVNASIGILVFIFIFGVFCSIILKSRDFLLSVSLLFLLALLIKFIIALLFVWQILLLLSLFCISLYLTFPINRNLYSVLKWLFSIIVFILLFIFLF